MQMRRPFGRRWRYGSAAAIKKMQKQTHFTRGIAGFYGCRWHSTTGREARPALIRLSRRSQAERATSAPSTFSRKQEREKGRGKEQTQKQSHRSRYSRV